jgi:hypothetical protein
MSSKVVLDATNNAQRRNPHQYHILAKHGVLYTRPFFERYHWLVVQRHLVSAHAIAANVKCLSLTNHICGPIT